MALNTFALIEVAKVFAVDDSDMDAFVAASGMNMGELVFLKNAIQQERLLAQSRLESNDHTIQAP